MHPENVLKANKFKENLSGPGQTKYRKWKHENNLLFRCECEVQRFALA